MATKKDPTLSADDLRPLFEKLPPEELFRLAYYALRIACEIGRSGAQGEGSVSSEGLPGMTEFHRSFSSPPYEGNSVVKMR